MDTQTIGKAPTFTGEHKDWPELQKSCVDQPGQSHRLRCSKVQTTLASSCCMWREKGRGRGRCVCVWRWVAGRRWGEGGRHASKLGRLRITLHFFFYFLISRETTWYCKTQQDKFWRHGESCIIGRKVQRELLPQA